MLVRTFISNTTIQKPPGKGHPILRSPQSVLLPHGKPGKAPLLLEFVEKPGVLNQARFKGRMALVPKLELSAYRFKAVVDWIKLRVSFAKGTQIQHVQRELRKFLDRDSWITPIAPGPGLVSSIFEITVQEPQSISRVTEMCAALAKAFGEILDPEICSVEFSLDAYPRKPSDAARELLVGAMQRTIFTTRDIWQRDMSRPRSSIGARTPGSVDNNNMKLLKGFKNESPGEWHLLPESHFSPWVDGTFYLGAKEDDVMIRVMDKTIDRQN